MDQPDGTNTPAVAAFGRRHGPTARFAMFLAVVATVAVLAVGCGDGSDDNGPDSGGGPLTVDDLIDSPSTADVEVRGLLFDDGSGLVLCGALAESFPPQCPGPKIPIANPQDVDAVFTEEGSVRWTDQVVTLTGRMTDGALDVDQ